MRDFINALSKQTRNKSATRGRGQDFARNLITGTKTDFILLYLSKAFYKVSHLNSFKLKMHGIDCNSLHGLTFLIGWTQTIILEG